MSTLESVLLYTNLFYPVDSSDIVIIFLFLFYRLGLFPFVSPAHVAQGLSAKDWCDACISVAVVAGGSGKGGGRPEQANATIVVPQGMDVGTILEAGRIFASLKLNLDL